MSLTLIVEFRRLKSFLTIALSNGLKLSLRNDTNLYYRQQVMLRIQVVLGSVYYRKVWIFLTNRLNLKFVAS